MGAGSTFSQGVNANTANPYAGTSSPYFQAANAQAQGNLAGAQQAVSANRVNQSTPYANLNYTQTGTDTNGNPIWSANQSLNPMFQGTLGSLAQNAQNASQSPINASQYQMGQVGQGPQFNQAGNAGNLQTSVAGTGQEGLDVATNAIMSRLNPQIAQQSAASDAQLANQGIVPGTQAYDNAKRVLNQGQNDLRTQAQLAGLQAQNTMFNQNVAAGQFGNQAVTQQNQNQLANLGFNNQTGQQGYANQLAGTQLNNAAQQANFANQLTASNNPLQQLGAFQSATQPGYANVALQNAVAGPDYMGALGTQTNANIAAQNAALGQATNQTAGLYGLGSAGILGLAANPRVASSIGSGLAGLGSSIYNGIFG